MSLPRVLVPLLLLLSTVVVLLPTAVGRTAEEWKGRTIYQLLTDRYARAPNDTSACSDAIYCGGTFLYLLGQLDYIQALGCDAIWISPIVANAPNGFHGYWATDLFTVNPHWGTADDLRALSAELHRRDMYLMLDVVANHMAALSMVGGDVSALHPFEQAGDYHDCSGCDADCNIDQWTPPNNTQIEHCRLLELMDLDQDLPYVRSTLLRWISELVTNYSVDGLRIDTYSLVKGSFWQEYYASAGVFAVGEVDSADVGYVASWQRYGPTVLSYPLFYNMRWVWTGGKTSMRLLYNLTLQYDAAINDTSVLVQFTDNHDNPRFLSLTSDPAIYRSALAYSLTHVGIPVLYYGSEQGFDSSTDPYSREPLWTSHYSQQGPYFPFLATLTRYRKAVQLGYASHSFSTVNDQLLGYVRGNSTLVVLTQAGSLTNSTLGAVMTGLPWADGVALSEVWGGGGGGGQWVVKGGSVAVQVVNGEPLVLTAVQRWADSSAAVQSNVGGSVEWSLWSVHATIAALCLSAVVGLAF